MKRTFGIIALCVGIYAFIQFVAAGMRDEVASMIPLILACYICLATAFVCLIGDVIRFVGKCFSQGFSAGTVQKESHFCPFCGKTIYDNDRFCSQCGCDLTNTQLHI